MEGISEISFPAVPTGREKAIRIGLWVAAFACLALSLLFWPALLGAAIFLAAAYFYSAGLDYEYEYIFSDRDISVDRIIQKSRRKTKVLIPFAEVEEVRAVPKTENAQGILCCNEDDPKIALICNGKQGRRTYLLLDSQAVRNSLFQAMPKKAVALKYNR